MDGDVTGLGLLRNPVGEKERRCGASEQVETFYKRQTQFISAAQSFIKVLQCKLL